MWVGDTEILLDDARRMADHLRRQGVDVHLTEAHNLPHVWPIFADWQLPESTATVAEIANVIQTSLDSASL
jgi:acetyl esterase/lipase